MVQIVDSACEVVGGKLVMVIESNSMEELMDHQIHKYAVEQAHRFGWPNACLNGSDPPSPVDENGNIPETFADMAKLANTKTPRFRKKIYLTTRF